MAHRGAIQNRGNGVPAQARGGADDLAGIRIANVELMVAAHLLAIDPGRQVVAREH